MVGMVGIEPTHGGVKSQNYFCCFFAFVYANITQNIIKK